MSGSHKKIGPRQLELLRRDGPKVVDWQRRVGLAEAKSRCVSLAIAGSVPLFGWAVLGWQPATLLLFVAVDIAAVLLGDACRLLLATPVLRRSHAADHRAQQLLSIAGGIDDGTGTFTEFGKQVSLGLMYGLALVFGALSGLLLGIAIHELPPAGQPLLAERGFLIAAAGSLLLHVGGALRAGWRARRDRRGDAVLFLDGGGVIGLGAGLLVLVWLPITLGAPGTILLLVALLLFRLAFGLFALWHIPRVTRALQRYIDQPPDPAAVAALAGRRRRRSAVPG